MLRQSQLKTSVGGDGQKWPKVCNLFAHFYASAQYRYLGCRLELGTYVIGKLPQNVDGNADGNRIPPQHAPSRQTPLKSGLLRRIPSNPAQRIGLRIRRSQVRVLPSAPRKVSSLREGGEEIKGRMPCCKGENPRAAARLEKILSSSIFENCQDALSTEFFVLE